jgi:hypothetical protein
MNIFILHPDPSLAAQMQCDKHLVKMVLETAQLLCSVYPPGVAPYKRTHYNHPCAKWARETQSNFRWLLKHGYALCGEYTRRYQKYHKTGHVITWVSEHMPELPNGGITPFAQAMPDQYKNPHDPVAAYRAYYRGEKAKFATWKYPASVPEWFTNNQGGNNGTL